MHFQWPPQGDAARGYMMRTAPLVPWVLMCAWTEYSYRTFYAGMMLPITFAILALKSCERERSDSH